MVITPVLVSISEHGVYLMTYKISPSAFRYTGARQRPGLRKTSLDAKVWVHLCLVAQGV